MYVMTVTSFAAAVQAYFEHLHYRHLPLPGCRRCGHEFETVREEEKFLRTQKPSALGES